jgi:Zn finger protein HypA/HybF involved in hydrogenase expression
MSEVRFMIALVSKNCPVCTCEMQVKKTAITTKTKWFWQRLTKFTEKTIVEYTCPMCLSYKQTETSIFTYSKIVDLKSSEVEHTKV